MRESNTEAEKGESSDSSKRFRVNFESVDSCTIWIWFIYRIDAKKEGGNYPSVVDDNGKKGGFNKAHKCERKARSNS